MILTLALSPSLDVTYEVDELHHGAITRPARVTRVAGGKPLNVARVARAMNADVRAIAALGGYTGGWIADLLAADDVAVDVIPIRHETRTCSAIVERSGGASSTDIYEPATPVSSEEWAAFRAATLDVADRHAGWAVFSGSIPQGVSADDVAGLLDELRARDLRVAVDSSGPGLRALAPAADLVKVNRAEAEEALGQPQPTARAAAHALGTEPGKIVIITDGIRGGHAVFGRDEFPLAPPKSIGRFSAGSGDTFLGALIAALDRSMSPAAALELASEAAERNALVPGPGRLDSSRI